jgi:hypothetical protein
MDKDIIEARQQLKDRMEKLLKRPPPTLEQVRKQWKASVEYAEKNPYMPESPAGKFVS